MMYNPSLKRTAIVYKCLLSFLAISLLLITVMVAASSQARAVSLRDNVVITDNTIKLGDIFSGLSAEADKVLGPAPQPGSEMVLNARTLMRVAVAMDLPWRPVSVGDQVVLRRAATIVTNNDIKAALKTALEKEGLRDDFDVSLSGPWPQMILPQDMPSNVEVSYVSYDPAKDWFQATLSAPSKDNPLSTSSISGRIEHIIKVPVLNTNIRTGTIIGKRDIEFLEINRRELQKDTVTSAEELIGTTPRRLLLAGKSIQTGEVDAPRIVERGDLVTMIFEEGTLRLTAKGKALENGAKGDFIRVVNTGSNKTIEGMVTGDKEILVQSF